MSSEPVYVDDAGRSGCRIALRIDNDGDIEFSGHPDEDIWINPAALVAALKELGVLAETADTPTGARRIEPSERLRESWRRAAAEDANERPVIEQHAYRRRLEAQRERERAAKLAGPRFFRDNDGDTWRSVADGRLTLWRMRSAAVDLVMTDPRSRAFVERAYGPLTEIPDPSAADALTVAYVARLREATRQNITRSVWRDF